jgi:hypothetical protein
MMVTTFTPSRKSDANLGVTQEMDETTYVEFYMVAAAVRAEQRPQRLHATRPITVGPSAS